MHELDYLQACVLGVVQGLTEFLPVSSSGHLVITQKLFGLRGDTPEMLLFDVVTHVGTLLAVMVVFARTFALFLARLTREAKLGYDGKRTAWLVFMLGIAACVPTAAIGFGFKDSFEAAFDSLGSTGVGLLISGTLLFIVGRLPRQKRGWRSIGFKRAVLIGIAQGCAILPGISRSGATICTSLMTGIRRRWAAEFSFFIAVPPILGAGAIKLKDTLELPADQIDNVPWGPILAGAAVSFIVGVAALRILLSLVIREKLQYFCYYCWTLGAVAIVYAMTA